MLHIPPFPELLIPGAEIPAWTPEEERLLASARSALQAPGLAAQLAEIVGDHLEAAFAKLPANWRGQIQMATRDALLRAADVAGDTIADEGASGSDERHRWLSGAAGGLSGLMGLPGLLWEIPLSTTLVMRSLLAIARESGCPLNDADTRLTCLEVFALGQPESGNPEESAYWSFREAIEPVRRDAARHVRVRGFSTEGAPALLKLTAAVALRFGTAMSQQSAAKAIPLVGAVSGAAVNVLFMRHFQAMGRAHFGLKQLERRHGYKTVKRRFLEPDGTG